jgi:hypothetical protein
MYKRKIMGILKYGALERIAPANTQKKTRELVAV